MKFLHILILPAFIASVFGGKAWFKPRIISGKPATNGEFPHFVILKESADDELIGGGSIIAKNWVLTAAHCTDGLESIFLVFGTNNLYDYTHSMTSWEMFIHPEYDSSTLSNDVSLIQLPKSLIWTPTIQPVRLPSTSVKDYVGSQGILAGFGYTSDEILNFSEKLLTAAVKIIPNKVCEDVFGSEYIQNSTMCAVGADGTNQSICTGDSGGPLVTADPRTGAYTQIGINSFVAEYECTSGRPSGYIRLASFISYIQEVTKLKF